MSCSVVDGRQGSAIPFLSLSHSQVVNSVAQAFQRVVDRISETVEAMEDDAQDIPLSAIMDKTLKELAWVRGRICSLCPRCATPLCSRCPAHSPRSS